MNKSQENAVIAHAESHPERLLSIPAFARGVLLPVKIEAINTAVRQQEVYASGVTTEKKIERSPSQASCPGSRHHLRLGGGCKEMR